MNTPRAHIYLFWHFRHDPEMRSAIREWIKLAKARPKWDGPDRQPPMCFCGWKYVCKNCREKEK